MQLSSAHRLRSQIPFRLAGSAAPAYVLDHARIDHTSSGLGWHGLHVEVGQNNGWSVDDLVIGGHYVALNLNPIPLVIERRTFTGFKPVEIPPNTLWVQPAGDPFTFRVSQLSRYAGIVLDPERARALLGADLAVEPAYGLEDGALAGLIRAAVAETESGGGSGRLFADGLTAALTARLGYRHGTEATAVKGGIAPRRLRHVIAFIDAHIAESLPLDALSGIAGLSPFHFARAFKQSTGTTPHRFLLDRRLDRARALLATGDRSVTETAYACGFSDHAHLSRAFRQRFGISPSTVMTSGRPLRWHRPDRSKILHGQQSLPSRVAADVVDQPRPKNRRQDMQKVSFQSGGETLIGDLYGPTDSGQYPAVVLLGPMTFQKEQAPTEYARRLGERGYVALAFDPRYRGESGGEPRCWENPMAKVEDVIAAVEYLSGLPQVYRDRIAGLAICQGSSEMLRAAADDARIRALATVAGHYRDREGDIAWLTDEGYAARLANGERAKRRYDETGEVEYVAGVDETDMNVGMPGKFVWDWYHVWADRGAWDNRYAVMSDADLLAFESISAARRLTAPWLMVHSNQCFLPDAARRHFEAAPSPAKQVSWEGDTPHLHYYDHPEVIDPTVERIAGFFGAHLGRADVSTKAA